MDMAMLLLGGISTSLGRGTMMLVILWLGGILLCAVPYLLGYVLSRVDRDAARPLPPNPEPPHRAETAPASPACEDETW